MGERRGGAVLQTDPASVERRLGEIAEVERTERRNLRRALLHLLFWPAVGIGGMAWGFQMNDDVWGPAIFYASAALGNAGILITLVAVLRRSER